MAQARTKNKDVYIPHPFGPQVDPMLVSRLVLSYQSNRENGQIVKRESPMSLLSGEYRSIGPKTANLDLPTTAVYSDVANWVGTSSQSYARAYRKFLKMAQVPKAEILLNVVEGRKSLEMIASRAHQLAGLARSLRGGRLGDAWRYMSLNPDSSLLSMKSGRISDSRFVSGKKRQESADAARRRRDLVRDVGGVILEWRYGWSPLLQDIQNAIEVLTKPIPDTALVARASERKYERRSLGGVQSCFVHTSEHCTVKGVIKVANPNLALANQLGFVNLPSVAWEMIPFSFVVDWFLPVGNYLQSFTDFVGLTLSEGSITMRRSSFTDSYPSLDYMGNYVYKAGRNVGVYGKKMVRTVGLESLPRPPLFLGTGLSPGRALNAVALLAQMLPGGTGGRRAW